MCTRARRATWCISLLLVGCLVHFLNEIILLWSVSSPTQPNAAIAVQELQHSVVVHRTNHSWGDRASTTTREKQQQATLQQQPPHPHRDIVHARYSYKAGFGSALVSLSGRLVQAARQGKRFRHEFTPGPWSYARGVCPQQDLSCYFETPKLVYADENNSYYPSNETEALQALLVLQPHMQAELDALSTPHPPQPCGVIHVRHADVTLNFDSNQSETPIFRYLSLDEHIRAFVKAAPNVRHVVLLTDDQDIVEQAEDDNNNHTLQFYSLPRPRWRGAQGGYNGHIPSGNPKGEVLAILQEMQMTRHCTAAWVGVSSSLGRLFRQLHPPTTVVTLHNKLPTTNHTLASRAFVERTRSSNTKPKTDLPLRFRPGFLRPNISSVDTLRHCHAAPFLGANPNLAKTSRVTMASVSVPLSLSPSPTRDKQWIHRVVPNRESETLMQHLTLHNITHQPTEHPLPTNNHTVVFAVTQDPLVHLVQHFETLQQSPQQRQMSRKDVFAALQRQDSFRQPESFDKYVAELYQLRQQRPLDPRLPLQSRYLFYHDLDHIYTSAADALHQVWPHILPSNNNDTLPSWWNAVELATQQQVCELLLLDYCCLNRRLPPPCAGLFYCLLTSNHEGKPRIQPWNDPV